MNIRKNAILEATWLALVAVVVTTLTVLAFSSGLAAGQSGRPAPLDGTEIRPAASRPGDISFRSGGD